MISLTRRWYCGAIVSSAEMTPASSLLTATIVTADIQLIERCKSTLRLRVRFFFGYVRRGLANLTESIFCGGNDSSAFVSWPTAALFDTFLYRSISVFSTERFSTSFLMNLAIGTVKAGSPIVRVSK